MKMIKKGLVIGPNDILAEMPKQAALVRSWDNTTAPKSQKLLRDYLNLKSAAWESTFDAAHHGRRYQLFVYRNPAERRACFDFLTGAQ